MNKSTIAAILASVFAFSASADAMRFVQPLETEPAPQGLDDTNIAIWQSHGWYFEPKLNRWEWQRARLFHTVEDLYTQSYVIPFIMPMLENAGAYVMSPRERDVNTTEIILDNDYSMLLGEGDDMNVAIEESYNERDGKHPWTKAKKPGFGYKGEQLIEDTYPFSNGTARQVRGVNDAEDASTASWSADIPADGTYAVYVAYQSLPESATDVVYTINTSGGPRHFKINQKMGGGTWIYLGHFPFMEGAQSKPIVEVTNLTSDKNAVVTADAVKIGGGMGNVARRVKEGKEDIDYKYQISKYPRFTEGARYWLQWAGAPDSVFTESNNVNDYTDDYRSRGHWVNWLAGGSKVLPKQEGLNIPIDLSFAMHTDAGTTLNDSIIGTLGIYCTDGKKYYPSGLPRLDALALTDSVMTNIVSDIRASFEPNWTRRDMWNKSYYEARVPEVPAMLLELLSHQNFADMKYGLDPSFRFAVSRAIYKGMLKYIAARDGRTYVVQPLPVNSPAISWIGPNKYRLTWKETVDTLEKTAHPTYYIVEERVEPSNGFKRIAKVENPMIEFEVKGKGIHSYRIIAGNDGGVSFPSEVLALSPSAEKPDVLVVNGFTRVSAPDCFEEGNIAGFWDVRDPGVPYVQDISFIGTQIEYRRQIPWMDDDAPGFGSCRSNYERDVIAGNTFDYPSLHGGAICEAGRSFVSASAEAFANGECENVPSVVDLILGKQKETKTGTGMYGTKHKSFPSKLQDRLREYTSNGGNVFVSGSFIASDLWDNPYSSPEVAQADKRFAKEVLGYQWRAGQASVTGEAYEVPSRFKQFFGLSLYFINDFSQDMYAVHSPDSFFAADEKGATIMRYNENNLIAGIAYDPGKYRTVVIGFPFETIDDASERRILMSQVLNFLQKRQ